jgi:PBSX family phage terminase large subunit
MTTAVEHRYRPEGSARTLFSCRSPEVLLSGAAGTGKSRACLEKLHAMCLANPGMRGLIVRKTAVSLTSTALVTFREIVAREALESGEMKFYNGSRTEAASYKYGNGSTITVGGMDKATRIMSSEYDAIYVQEATELFLDDWESLTTRLRNGKVSFQQLMADCNPNAPHHWLKQRSDTGITEMIYCQHEDNPRLYRDGQWTDEGQTYIRLLDNLTGVRKQRLRYGLWVAAEGLVYDTFDPAVHFHKPVTLPPRSWTRYLSVDFGYTNPFVCQFWAEDPDGRLLLYREIYATKRLVEDHARQINELIRRGDGHQADVEPTAIICDHDAEDRATLERHLGRSTIAANKNVSEGLQAVMERLKPAGDGKPRLFLCRDALTARDEELESAHKPVCTNDEVLEYIWDPAKQRAAGNETASEAPLKQNDHGMDAMRYLVAHVDLVGAPRFRSFRY